MKCFYASMKTRMIEPLLALAWSAFEAFRKLPKMIDELPVQVLDAPLDLALVLRMRRMRKMRVLLTCRQRLLAVNYRQMS